MRICYLNQGDRTNPAATINYKAYDILLFAERAEEEPGFSIIKKTAPHKPYMSIQVRKDCKDRLITAPQDLDIADACVRPVCLFDITCCNTRVVFLHLKSGDERTATAEYNIVFKRAELKHLEKPTIWIGDFNRATVPETEMTPLVVGGGQSEWYLDRAYIRGAPPESFKAGPIAETYDNGHIAIGIEFEGCGKHKYEHPSGRDLRMHTGIKRPRDD